MHQKHEYISRPQFGTYARKEISFIGAPCGTIKKLVTHVTQELHSDRKIGWLDADHKASDYVGAYELELINKIGYYQLNYPVNDNPYQIRSLMNDVDVLFVNGNHFKATNQLVFLDSRKKDSLQRKLDRLDDVIGFISNDVKLPYSFLSDIPGISEKPIFHIDEVEKLSAFIAAMFPPAPLYGLVLSGGKSSRMGIDKGKLNYHGLAQKDYLYELLSHRLDKVFISEKHDYISDNENGHIIRDRFLHLGPKGAILSAFQLYPDAAFLVVACDLPFVDTACINQLITERNASVDATAFYNNKTKWMDPLLTIWEPRSYAQALKLLSQGYNCPRKILINSNTNVIQPNNPKWLFNANTPEERKEAIAMLQ